MNNQSVWIFGYGSLLWKADFEYKQKIVGYVKNFQRRFWLLSDDHRGTPVKPGRVVTLVEPEVTNDDDAIVLGFAYEIESDKVESTFRYLDFREKCGYTKHEVHFYPLNDDNGSSFKCFCYYANEKNEYYSKILDNMQIARHISDSIGPSGTNVEYFTKLCNIIRQIIIENELDLERFNRIESHIFDIDFALKKISNTN